MSPASSSGRGRLSTGPAPLMPYSPNVQRDWRPNGQNYMSCASAIARRASAYLMQRASMQRASCSERDDSALAAGAIDRVYDFERAITFFSSHEWRAAATDRFAEIKELAFEWGE